MAVKLEEVNEAGLFSLTSETEQIYPPKIDLSLTKPEEIQYRLVYLVESDSDLMSYLVPPFPGLTSIGRRGKKVLSYSLALSSHQAVASNQTHWRKFIKEALTPEKNDFTTLQLLYHLSIPHDSLKIEAGSWMKPGKPFSGDLAFIWQQEDLILGVVADGASMMLKPNELQPEIVKTFTFLNPEANQRVFLPDHAWSVFVSRALFGSNYPKSLPQLEQQVAPYRHEIPPAFKIVSQYSPDKIPTRILEECQNQLRQFYSSLLPKLASEENVAQFPSGVMLVFTLSPSQDKLWFAYTGDVNLYLIDDYYGGAKCQTTELVSPHDSAADYVGRSNRKLIKKVARQRVPQTGNLTGLVKVSIHQEERDFSHSAGLVVITDGAQLKWAYSQFPQNRRVESETPLSHDEVGATLLFRNPYLFQTELIRMQRKFREHKQIKDYWIPKGLKWRADDATWIGIARIRE